MAKGAFLPALVFEDQTVKDYLAAVSTMRENTYISAKTRMSLFPQFAKEVYGLAVDELIKQIKDGKQDRYSVLSQYAAFAKHQKKTDNRIRSVVKQARLFFEYHDIEIADRRFRAKVKLPRLIQKEKKPVNKPLLIDIIQHCPDIDLRMCLLWHGATGRRPQEVFSLRWRDIDLENKRFTVRAEFTKMGIEQTRPMTDELVKETMTYKEYKHRRRTVIIGYEDDGTPKRRAVVPEYEPDALIFATFHSDREAYLSVKPSSLYEWYGKEFQKLLDGRGYGKRVSSTPKARREITFYSFRRYVKTTTSNIGFRDFGEWLIGHAKSVYWEAPEEEKAEVFGKVQQYLTFLDIKGLEAKGADQQSQIETLQKQVMKMAEDHKKDLAFITWLVQQDTRFAHVKPEELAKFRAQFEKTMP